MAEEGGVITLANFAPLIQLWAGFCLLFFYETLFKRSPLAHLVEGLKKLYEEFQMDYINFIPKNEILDLDRYAQDNWEEHILPTIKNLASLTFFYSVFILAFIGIENVRGLGDIYVCALQPINFTILLYCILAVIFLKSKIFHTYWTPIIGIFAIILYIHCFKYIDSFFLRKGWGLGSYWEQSSISIFTLFTLFAGLAVILIRLWMVWVKLYFKRKALERLNNNCILLADVMINSLRLNELPKSLLDKIQPKINDRLSNKGMTIDQVLQESIKEEIQEEYRTLSTGVVLALLIDFKDWISRRSWYQLHSPNSSR